MAIIGQYQGIDITGGTDAEVKAQVQAIDARRQASALPTAPTSPDGAVSSADMLTGKQQGRAITNATGALTGGTTDPYLNTYNQLTRQMTSSFDDWNDLMSKQRKVIDQNYDADLGMLNAQYKGAFDQLAQSHSTEVQAGQARAAALNPYSESRGSSTAQGFTQALNQRYQQQYQTLTAQMQAAQRALQAGRGKEYAELQRNALQGAQTFQKEMRSFVTDFMQQSEQRRQFEVSQGNLMERAASDDFRSMLTTLSGSPQLQSEIESYKTTGKISAGLMPIIEKGMQAGMSPDEAISIFQYQSDAVRKQEALENYRQSQLLLSQERLALSQEKQTNAQRAIATTQMVLQAQSDMRAQGIQPGTAAWANGVAAATSASPKTLTTGQVSKYTQMGVLANQLTGVKTNVDAVSAKDPLWNTLQTYAGRDVSSMSDSQLAELNARLTSLSGVIGKTFFGESGNLSNTDIQRVLNAMPTGAGSAELRQALYKGLISVAKDNATLTLESDAQAGYNVAAYVDSVNRINTAYEKVQSSTSTGGAGTTYKGFTLPY